MGDRNLDVKPSTAPPEPLRILLVEDDDDIRDSLCSVLEHGLPGVEVVAAASGAEAIRLFQQAPLALVITDYRMPGMDGLALLAELRRRDGRVPAIMISAFSDVDLAVRAVDEARVRSFLVKPLEPEQVLRVVGGVLEAWRADEHGELP